MQLIKEKLEYEPTRNMTGSKESKDIEKQLANLFNFEKVVLTWQPSLTANAYTLPFGNSIIPLNKSNFDLVKNSKGYQFKQSKGKIIFITLFNGLFTVADLEPREATAFLLHEVGHNFFITERGRILTPIYLLIAIIKEILDTASNPQNATQLIRDLFLILKYDTRQGRVATAKIRELDEKNGNILSNISGRINLVTSTIMEIINTSFILFAGPVLIVTSLIQSVVQTPTKILLGFVNNGYRNEKFADNFATMYGYGVEISSGLAKINKYSNQSAGGKTVSEIPLVNVYYETISLTLTAIMSLADEHPTNITRVKEQERFLQECLTERDIPPKTKKEIEKQIKSINEIYYSFYINKDDPNIQSAFYEFKTSLGMSDEDWKEILYKSKNYNYENIFDAHLN